MDATKSSSEEDNLPDISLEDNDKSSQKSKSKKTRMFSIFGINREEDNTKKDTTNTSNTNTNNTPTTPSSIQNPVFGRSKNNIKRISRSSKSQSLRSDIVRDLALISNIHDSLLSDESEQTSTTPPNAENETPIPSLYSSVNIPPTSNNNTTETSNSNNINNNTPSTPPINSNHSPSSIRNSITHIINSNNSIIDTVNKSNNNTPKWVSTKSSTKLPIQYSFLQSSSRILPIAVIGSHSVGKRRLIDSCFLYDTISQCVPAPPPFNQANFKKKKSKRMTPLAHSGNVDMDGRTVSFSIARYNDLAATFPYKTINHFIVVFDISRVETLEFAQQLMKEIQKNYSDNNYSICLVANKIEKCSASSSSISESFYIGFKIACEFNAKFIAITNEPVQIDTVGNFVSNIIANTTTFHNYIYHQNANFYIENNQLNSFIFDDFKSIQKEEFLWVLKQNSNSSDKEEWIRHYGAVKGDFFIYCDINSNTINTLYLPICEFKIRNQSNGKFIWEIKNKKDQMNITFAADTLKSFSEWIYTCCRDLDMDVMYENIFQLFGDLQLQTPKPLGDDERFSSILHNSLRIFCVDCGLKGCSNFISKQFGVFLCYQCSTIHSRIFGRDSKITSLEDIENQKNIFPLFHINCNNYFNVLYEGLIQLNPNSEYKKITKNSSMEERINFIRDKYEKLKYYLCPTEQLFLITLLTNDQNQLDYSKLKECKSEVRYLEISAKYFILLYADSEKKNLLQELHISCCFFRLGREIGLPTNYFQIFVPNQTFLFKATSTQTANRWSIIFKSSLLRSKLTEYKSFHSINAKLNIHNNQHYKNNNITSPTVTSDANEIPHKINKRISHYKSKSLEEKQHQIVEREPEVKMTKERVEELLKEKNSLRVLRQNYQLQLQLKDYLEMKLSETLNTLKDLEIKEKKSLQSISNIEPMSIQQEVALLSKLLDENNSEYETIIISNDENNLSSDSKRISPINNNNNINKLLNNNQSNINNNNNNNNIIINNINTNNNGGQHMEGNNGKLIYESISLIFNAENGNVKGGSLDDLVEILISQDYNESNYCDHFLKIYPSFTSSFDFVKILSRKFSSPIQNKEQHGNVKKRFAVRLKKDGRVNYKAFIKAARVRVLSVLETWLSEYWKSDFECDFQLITFIHSFFDYIVENCEGYGDYAQILRNKVHQCFNNSYIVIDYSNIQYNPLEEESALENSNNNNNNSNNSLNNNSNNNITPNSPLVNSSNNNNNSANNNSNNNNNNAPNGTQSNSQNNSQNNNQTASNKENNNGSSVQLVSSQSITHSSDNTQLITPKSRMSIKALNSNSLTSTIDVIIELDPFDIAKQLCSLDFELFCKIRSRELLNKNWMANQKEVLAPNIIALTERFNRTSQWVSSMIVKATKLRQRIKIVERFIVVAQKARELQNLHGVVAIVGGLQDPSVLRLKRTWEGVNSKLYIVLQDLVKLIQVADNWANYRKALGSALISPNPCVPYIGIYLKDLVYLEDGLPNFLSVPNVEENLVINYDKRRKIALILSEIQTVQKSGYNLPLDNQTRITIIASFFNIQLLDEEERYQASKKIEAKSTIPQRKKT